MGKSKGIMKEMPPQQRKAVGAAISEAAAKMLSPNKMETPLESNKFIGERKKAIDTGKDSFVVDGKTYKVTGSPTAMVGAMAGGMLGQGQVIDQGQVMSNIPPDPSSMRPQFSAITGDKAQGMFGDQYMRQASVNAPYKFPVSPVNPINKYKD